MSMADLYKQFPDVHPNIVLKTDVLRQGLRISERACRVTNNENRINIQRHNNLSIQQKL